MPIIGLVIALILGVIAWVIAPTVLEALAKALPNFRGNELPLSTTRPIFTAIIVVLTLIIFGLAAALITPKDPQSSSEGIMEKEREELWRRQKAERAQQRKPKGSR
jgi:hypothetical protein